ncbi:MAG: hypothetical protein ACE5GW_04915 [Planctomycetota bacterium]
MRQECQQVLVEWLAQDGEPSPELDRHLEECPACRSSADGFSNDRSLLVSTFRSCAPPPAPRLEFRHPLKSASGHPRRISLAILPFLLALLLVFMLLVVALTLVIQTKLGRDRRFSQARNEILRIEVALAQARESGMVLDEGAGWAEQLLSLQPPREFLPTPSGDGSGGLLDPFARPYLRRTIGTRETVYSAGENGLDERGEGDDITSPRLGGKGS